MSPLRIAIAGLCVLLLLVACLLLAPFTATGSRLIVAMLDGLGGLEFEYHSGDLMGELGLARVLVPTDTVVVDVRGGRVVLDHSCLLRAKLCLKQLSVESVDVELLLPEEEPGEEDDEDYLFWPLPFAISSGNVAIDTVRVHWDGAEILTKRVAGAAHLVGNRIGVSDARAHGTRLLLSDTDGEESEGPLDLPDVDLPVTITLDSVTLHDSQWDIYGLRNDYDLLRVAGQWLGTRLEISDGHIVNSEWGSLDLAGELVFIHPYQLRVSGEFEAQQPPWWRGLHGAQGKLTLGGNLASLQLQGTICAALPLDLHAEIDLVAPDWPLSLEAVGGCGRAQSDIALNELPDLEQLPELLLAPDWSLLVDGDMREQLLTLQMAVSEAEYGPLEVQAEASNKDGALHLAELLATRPGEEQSLRAAGELQYLDQLAWDLALTVQEVELPQQLAPLAGQLTGSLQTRGRLEGEYWSVELSRIALRGDINELPATMAGDVRLDQAFNLDGSELRAELNGANLWLVDREGTPPRADITVEDFARWMEGAGGRLQATLSWNREIQRISLEGSTAGIRLGPLWLNEGSLKGWHDYSEGGSFRLDIGAERVRVGEQWNDTVELVFQGTAQQHQLRLAIDGELSTELALDGSLVEGDWGGRLQPMTLATSAGSWRLESPVVVDYLEGPRQITLADHCWLNEGLDLCIVEMMLGESGALEVDLDGDLAAFSRILPNQFRVRAPLAAKVDALWKDLEMQTLRAGIEIQAGGVREQLLGGELAEYAWEGISLTYRGSHEHGRLLGSLHQGGVDKLALDLTLPAAMDGPVAGSFQLRGLQLNAFNAFLEQFSHLSGEATGDLLFAGRMREPEIRGDLTLRNGAVALTSSPNQLEDILLEAQFTGRQATLSGEVAVGGGNSKLQGELDWLAHPRLSLAMAGGPKQLLFPVETTVTVSENLLLEITAERVSLTGSVDVPSGKFVLGQLPQSAVEVSDDVLLFDHTGEQLGQGGRIPVEIEIRVSVADKFEVATTGIDGRLGGDLLVRRPPGRPMQVLGNVKIHEGKFELLGPRFNVKRGQLSFVGVPDNPNLDIVLERLITEDQVTVGIRVAGSLDLPKLDFYSRPALPEKEVMAYVLGGRGIDRTGDSDSMALAMAMTSGLMQSKGLLKGVSLGVEGRDRKARAAIGGYISDRIYMSYGVGLYQPINTLTVRMDIIRNLWVEMVSGLESSADIYYAWSKR